MIGPVLLCCFCLACLAEGGAESKPIPRPKKRRQLDRLLCRGLSQGYDAEQLVAWVLGRMYPNRNFANPTAADTRVARQLTARIRQRLRSPAFQRMCRGSRG